MDDEAKVFLLRITESELSSPIPMVEVRLGKCSDKLTVQIPFLYINNVAFTEHLSAYYRPCHMSVWIQSRRTGVSLTKSREQA